MTWSLAIPGRTTLSLSMSSKSCRSYMNMNLASLHACPKKCQIAMAHCGEQCTGETQTQQASSCTRLEGWVVSECEPSHTQVEVFLFMWTPIFLSRMAPCHSAWALMWVHARLFGWDTCSSINALWDHEYWCKKKDATSPFGATFPLSLSLTTVRHWYNQERTLVSLPM